MPKIILVANTDWYLYNFRLSLIRLLREEGWEPVLVSPPGKYVPLFEQEGLRHIAWHVGRQSVMPWQELPAVRQLQQIYRAESPDLIHHHTNKAVLYGSMAARGLGIPLVNSIPGRGFVFSSPSLKARLIRPITELLFLAVLKPYPRQAMIFENRADQAYFIQRHFISAEKTTLIPSVGVDLSRYVPTDSFNQPPVIGFTGRMLWGKGAGIFAEAARLLKQRGVACRMVLVGLPDYDNPDYVPTETLQAWANEGLLEWWGWRDDMSDVYRQLDILAVPTQYGEGVPTTLIEAAASRRALVASDWPGCREVITHGETGLLTRPGDPVDLADSLAELISDEPLRTRLAEAACALVREKFSTACVNEKTMDIYTQISNP